jgi:hypothetical protein
MDDKVCILDLADEYTGVMAPQAVTTAWKLRVARRALEEIERCYSGGVAPSEVHKGWHIARAALATIGRN